MTTHLRYHWVHPTPWTAGRHQEILEFLNRKTEGVWWFRDLEVQGAPYNRLVLSFVASGRDRWWCHRRAQGLVLDVYYMLCLREQDLPEPVWESLPPHMNRGRYRTAAAS